jgi:hypothetical protein
MVSINTPAEIQADLAIQLRMKRKALKHSRVEAARLTGVPAATLRKFESTGEISLRQFMMIVHVYGELSLFDQVFPKPIAKSMDELIKLNSKEKKI